MGYVQNINNMSRIIKSTHSRRTRIFSWILLGGSFAPLLVILYSYIKADPGMRITPVLILMCIIGAVAGRLSYEVRANIRFSGWKRISLYLLSFLIYLLLIALGFVLSMNVN